MTLTGKAKEQFDKWFLDNIESMWSIKLEPEWEEVDFNSLPPSMQFGTYQEWADSIGYNIEICNQSFEDWFEFYVLIDKQYVASRLKSRAEANKAAIDNLNILINKQ